MREKIGMNHTKRFDGKGELYAKARPQYAKELFEHLKNTMNIPEHTIFADVGSGTGIHFFDGNCEVFRADNSQVYNRQGYIDRVLSSSYSLREEDPRYAEYLDSIGEIFDRFSDDGLMTVPTYTVAYIGFLKTML